MYILENEHSPMHIHPQTDTYSPIVSSVCPIQMYPPENAHFPNLRVMLIPQPCAQRAHRHPPTDTYSPIVGSVYPIQMYPPENAHFPNLRQRAHRHPTTDTYSPIVGNTNVGKW